MPTQNLCVALMLCTVILFSCNRKKTKNYAAEVTAVAISTVLPPADKTNSMQDYSNAFIKEVTQVFTAARKRITVITARKGLKVTVNPAMLEKQDGSKVDGKITVNIVELTTSEELLKSNAATVSNGRLLMSGGSYFIGMECNGQQLKIKEGRELKIEFPKLKDNEMELFCGNRDTSGNMNWLTAEQPLSFNTAGNFYEYTPPYPDSLIWKPYTSKYHLYESVSSKVIFDGRRMPLKEMVDVLQKKGIDKNIDTVTVNWREFDYKKYPVDCMRSRMYSWKMYRLISCKELEAEKDSLAEEEKIKAQYIAANKKYDEEWNRVKEENSFTNQLQKYYNPSAVNKLGWINCDRFYGQPQDTEVPLELPITFNKPVIDYFIVYKSFNGLINGRLGTWNNQQYVLNNLPAGQAITFIAFIKSNGQIFHCKEDFLIGKNKSLKPEFKNITAEELTKFFGKNVRI